MQTIIEKAKKIKMLVTDVDGVLTDGSLNFFYDNTGSPVEIKRFNSLDGVGITALKTCGIQTAIITGGKASATEIMAKSLGFNYLYHGFFAKKGALEDLSDKTGLSYEEMAFVGDDIIDIPVLKRVGLACVVPNAAKDMKTGAHYFTKTAGGYGAIREVAEFILTAQGKWDKVLKMVDNGTFLIDRRGEMAIIEGPVSATIVKE